MSKHIAGIVPVSKIDSDFESVVPACMSLLSNGFYAIQRSIFECACAGCKTIWVVCDDSVAPLIKKVCGDFIQNPIAISDSKYKKFPQEHLKSIPIFYAPLSYKHQNKEGIAVSVVEGILSSFMVSDKISKWVVPQRYYVSSPYGAYDPSLVTKVRSNILSNESFVLTHKGQSVFTGEHLGFSLSARQFKHCNYLFRRMDSKTQFDLDIIFNDDIMKENMATHEINSYHNIKDWAGYQTMFESGVGFEIYSSWKNMFTGNIKKV